MTDLTGYPSDFIALLELYNKECALLMGKLEHQTISVTVWKKGMTKLLAKYGLAARMLGGDLTSLSNEDFKSVAIYLNEQLPYLESFATVIRSSAEFDPSWNARANLYGASIVTEYWEGKTSDLPLPAQPGQGTQCLGNCRCSWRIDWIDKKNGDADCYWELERTAAHCQTCEERARMWYPIQVRGGNLL